MTLINLSIHSLEVSKIGKKYAELAFSFCTLVINLGNFIKGFLSKHLQKYSTRFINMQLLIIEKKKSPVYDLISPGIGLKFGLITFCFQAQYDSFYNVKNIYIYELSLVPKMLTQDSEQY